MKLRRSMLVARLVALSSVAAAVSVAGGAPAQVPVARAPVPPRTVAPTLALRPVNVSPALQSALAQKAVFDPAKLQTKLTYVGKSPQLEIPGGKKVLLEPASEAPPAVTAANPALRTQLTKYAPHISARYVGKARAPLAFEKIVHNKQWQTAIKDQGSRGTCVAFASMAGIEWMYKKAYGSTRDLSENHAYNIFMSKVGSTCVQDPGIQTVSAPDYLKADLVCDEASSAYVSTTASSCSTIPAACTAARRHGIATASKFYAPDFGGTGDEVATNTNYLEALVNLGLPVVMGVHMAGSGWSDGTAESGVVDVQRNGNGTPAGSFGGHAMTLVGYNSTADYFIFKNSWGTAGGHDGYYHLSYEYLQTYAKYGYVIVAVPNPG